MELQELNILGLSQGEIKVYSAILHLGTSSINNIHEKTGMERRAIYDIINKLLEKGFITYTIERKKRTYQCTPINKLKEEAEKRIHELNTFKNLIPRIEYVYKQNKPKTNLEAFRGKDGISAVFEDMLNYKEVYFIGGKWYVAKEMPNFWGSYDQRRIKAGTKWYNLVLHDAPIAPTDKLVEIKTLPKEFSWNPSLIWIYGNKVVNVLWGEEKLAFMIENKEIAENYKRYFDFLWKIAKK